MHNRGPASPGPNGMLKALRHEYRSHAWARFTFWLIISGLILWAIKSRAGLPVGPLWAVFVLAAVVAGVYYLWRLLRIVRRRLLWRLTRRLIVAYLFIAFVPILLILVLVGLGAVILNGQFAAYLVNARLQNHFDELKQLNRVVAHEAVHVNAKTPDELFDRLESFYVEDLSQYSNNYPRLEITLHAAGKSREFTLSGRRLNAPMSPPRWFKSEEWAGIVAENKEISLRAIDQEKTKAGNLTLVLAMPVTPELLNMIGEGIGPVTMLRLNAGDAKRDRGASPREVGSWIGYSGEVRSSRLEIPRQRIFFDFPVAGASAVNPVDWNAPKFERDATPVLVAVNSRIFALNAQLLGVLGRFSEFPVVAFIVVGAVFLQIELFALIIGILLTRSITSTVNRLQVATERVRAGDFAHRIGLPARDQLSALGTAFDTMTASVERLLVESREKTRLENELNIAREVQRQLFPQSSPEIEGAHIFGECRPAGGVSGDYYDFLELGRRQVGLVLGDVSGKGIYAALLMAGIQSAVRGQVFDATYPSKRNGEPHDRSFSTAGLIERLNRQIFENTPDAKYATFFYAIFDAPNRSLMYTNAGHPPPFLFRKSSLSKLEEGGTVLGIFPDSRYEQRQVQLEHGDVLFAYTDGLVEPENSYGEEFGEARLLNAVRESLGGPPEVMAEGVYRAIADWTGGGELQDDMTMLYLQVKM